MKRYEYLTNSVTVIRKEHLLLVRLLEIVHFTLCKYGVRGLTQHRIDPNVNLTCKSGVYHPVHPARKLTRL